MARRPDSKNLFDRDPLLIPQLFVDPVRVWYRRPSRWLAIFGSILVVTAGVLVALLGPRGAAQTAGRSGAAVLHAYARMIAGGPPTTPAPEKPGR